MSNGHGRAKRLIAGGVLGASALTFAPTTAGAAISTATFCASVADGSSGFTDLALAGVHADNVECLKASGVTAGTSATTYSPQQNVSRAQMATFIANMIDRANALDAPGGTTIPDLPTAAASDDAFTDDETSIHENNINRLAEAGIISGTSATTFSPSANVSRAQMASFIAQALAFIRGGALPEGSDAFTDDETSVHEANINRLANAEIVGGVGGGLYNPDGLVSRAQMASFIIQAMADLNADGFISVVPATGGPITLQSTTVTPGGAISGVVADSANVANVRANGCGIANNNVAISGTGGFQLNVPTSQAPGTCTITFTVTRLDGSVQTQQVTITVAPSTTSAATAGPDLLSATVISTANRTVRFHFDEVVANTPAATAFWVWDAAGILYPGATIVAVNGADVTVQFGVGTPIAEVTLASVGKAAVNDAGLNPNPETSVPVQSTTFAAGQTTGPDLLSVSAPVQIALGIYQANFRFDEPVAVATPSGFWLVDTDGNAFTGAPGPTLSADSQTVTVTFLAVTSPLNALVRGGADTATVTDAGGTPNALTTEPVTGKTDITVGPDLVGGAVASATSIAYDFDEVVATPPGAVTTFVAIQPDGTEINPTAVVRSPGDASVVVATFASAATVANAVGISVMPGAVTDTDPVPNPNERDEAPLQSVSFQAGRTALPDLVSVTEFTDELNRTIVRFTFDQNLPAGYVIAGDEGSYGLYDAQANETVPTVGTGAVSGATVTFVNGFPQSVVDNAVLGTVFGSGASYSDGSAPVAHAPDVA